MRRVRHAEGGHCLRGGREGGVAGADSRREIMLWHPGRAGRRWRADRRCPVAIPADTLTERVALRSRTLHRLIEDTFARVRQSSSGRGHRAVQGAQPRPRLTLSDELVRCGDRGRRNRAPGDSPARLEQSFAMVTCRPRARRISDGIGDQCTAEVVRRCSTPSVQAHPDDHDRRAAARWIEAASLGRRPGGLPRLHAARPLTSAKAVPGIRVEERCTRDQELPVGGGRHGAEAARRDFESRYPATNWSRSAPQLGFRVPVPALQRPAAAMAFAFADSAKREHQEDRRGRRRRDHFPAGGRQHAPAKLEHVWPRPSRRHPVPAPAMCRRTSGCWSLMASEVARATLDLSSCRPRC